jgi:hypothetical protein
MPFLLYGILALAISIQTTWAADQQHPPNVVSMIELIANKEKYNGKPVQVSGYLSVRFEDDALYFDENAYEHMFTENALWISIDDKDRADFKTVNHRYGYVTGVFSANTCNGNLCLYGGEIKSAHVGLTYKEISDGDEQK